MIPSVNKILNNFYTLKFSAPTLDLIYEDFKLKNTPMASRLLRRV